jgi:hypothetical protein
MDNPERFTDPTGHIASPGLGEGTMQSFIDQEWWGGGSIPESDIFQMYKGEQATLAANEPHGLVSTGEHS